MKHLATGPRPHPTSDSPATCFLLALETAGACTWVWNPRAGVLAWSTGDAGGSVSAEGMEHVLAQIGARAPESLVRALAESSDFDAELSFVRADGAPGWLACRGGARANGPEDAARMAGVLIDVTPQKRAEEQAAGIEARMGAVAGAASALVGARTMAELREVLRQACERFLPVDAFFFATLDADQATLHFEGGCDRRIYEGPASVALAGTPSEGVVRTQRSLVTLRSDDPRARGAQRGGTGRPSESVIRTPIVVNEVVRGIVSVQSYTPELFTAEDAGVLESLAALAGIAILNIEHLNAWQAANEQIREREERLALALEGAEQGLWDWNVATNEVRFNEPWARMLGYELTEIPNLISSWTSRVHADDLPGVQAKLEAHVQGRVPAYEAEYRMQCRDGRWIWTLDRGRVLVRDEHGRPLRMAGTRIDITPRRTAELQLQRRDAVLEAVGHAAERLLREGTWHESMQEVLARLGRATEACRAYVFDVYHDAENVLRASQRYEWVAPGIEPQIDLPELQNFSVFDAGFGRWVELLSQGELVQGVVSTFPTCERELLDVQGVRSLVVVPVLVGGEWWGLLGFDECRSDREWSVSERDALRAAAGIVGAAIQRERAEASLKDSQAQLLQVQKLDAVGRLAGGIAHDFNNLLTAISGNTALLLASVPDTEPCRVELDEIRQAADRAASLTRQLLAYGRRQVLNFEMLDLNDQVRHISGILRRLVPSNIRIRTELDASLGAVRADPGQIDQVILNLVINAGDAMPEGGELLIQTRSQDITDADRSRHSYLSAGAYSALCIRDTGSGMSEPVLAQCFEPFFTTKETGKGTGLGLSTVYGIVKQSGGNVLVESQPGVGTMFTVLLPRLREPFAAAGEKAAALPQPRRGRETVLLVEDEEAVRRLARRVLERSGYRILEAADGEEALRVYGEAGCDIDLLLSDVMMPGMGGPALTHRLVARQPGLRVILMSGYAGDVLSQDGRGATGAAFLQKPFTPDLLALTVRSVLDHGGPGAPHP